MILSLSPPSFRRSLSTFHTKVVYAEKVVKWAIKNWKGAVIVAGVTISQKK